MKRQISRSSVVLFLVVVTLSIPAGVFGQGRGDSSARNAKPSGPTPRTADGKPDFSGYWGELSLEQYKIASPTASIADGPEGGDGSGAAFTWWITHFEMDAQVGIRAQTNRPIYKPEYWDKIRANDWDYSRKHDPGNRCLPGVPRLGLPQKIVQTPNEMVFLYERLNRFRIIPTDNRPHNETRSQIPSWFGDSVGHWEGDTLVIETTGLIDQSWLGPSGYVHTEDTKVTERMHRDGNTLFLETTVEDPMLLQPWQMTPVSVKLNPDPTAAFAEELCDDRDSQLLLDPKNQDPTHQGR
jgi:hypothetical protein